MFYTATDPPAARILGIDNPNQWASPSRYQNFSPSTEEKTNRSDSHAHFIEETILGAFRELLTSKDDRDAELEKKLVEMSFELASLSSQMSMEPRGGFCAVAAMQTLLRLLLSNRLTSLCHFDSQALTSCRRTSPP